MHYEIYIDELFIQNFVLSLYGLVFLNCTTPSKAGIKRLLIGAVCGGALTTFLLFLPYRRILYPPCFVLPLWLTFHPLSPQKLCRLTVRLLAFLFLFGGICHFIADKVPGGERFLFSVTGLLLTGALLTVLGRRIYAGTGKTQSVKCEVCLENKAGEKRRLLGIFDSGNGLYEPISGKPVCVMDPNCAEGFLTEEDLYRAIPYRSIGCGSGILKGYLFPRMTVHYEGESKEFSDVYVGVSNENVLSNKECRILVHPAFRIRKEE